MALLCCLALVTLGGDTPPLAAAASYQPNPPPSNLTLLGLDSTLVANWTPSNDQSIAWQVVTAYGANGQIVGTKVVPAQQSSVDLNDLQTGASFKVTVQAMNGAGALSAAVKAEGSTMAQQPMPNAAFFDNFDAMPMDNLPSGFQMGDLDPNYYDVRTMDIYGDLAPYSWARQVMAHERHFHTLLMGSQGEAGILIRPRVPVDLSGGRTATFQFEVDLAPGQRSHGKWFEIYLVDANDLPSTHEDLTPAGDTGRWPNTVEFDVFQSADSAGINGHNLPSITVNVNGTITRGPVYTNSAGFAIPSALQPQYTPVNVRVPVLLKVSQTAASMYINGRPVASLSGFQLPYTLGSWELMHKNYRSALFDYTGYPKPASMTLQMLHWDTLQFDGPTGSYNPIVRTYVQQGCRGQVNIGVNGDTNRIEGCGPFLSGYQPNATVTLNVTENVSTARSGLLAYNGGGVSSLKVSINGNPPITLPTKSGGGTSTLTTYKLKPSELSQLKTGNNNLSFTSNASTIYGLSSLELEAVYNAPRMLESPPQDYTAETRLTKDNFRFDYIPSSSNPVWQQPVQTATTYLYNTGGTRSAPYSIQVLTPRPWLTVSSPGGLSGTLASPAQGGPLQPIELTVNFNNFVPGSDPSLGQPAVIAINGGDMPVYLAVLAVARGSETPNVIPESNYYALYSNAYNQCGGNGTLGVPGYENACAQPPPATSSPTATATATSTRSMTPTATSTPSMSATATPSVTLAATKTPTLTSTPRTTATLIATVSATNPSMMGLHVSGNQVVNDSGKVVRLLGVNRGAANACIQGWGIFSGPADESTVQAMATWNIRSVRIPLNEDCWLGINDAPAQYSGANYQQAIVNYVGLLNKYNIAAILDLHWSAPGNIQAQNQQPMADADNSPAFWTSVANTFMNNSSVVFDLYNEPYPDNNQDTTAAWDCLLNGCQQAYYVNANGNNVSFSWQAAGMNQLVSAVRSTGATNLIITAGVGWAGLMTQWLQYVPTDPQNNLAASTHIYPNTWCSTQNCWNSVLAPITAQYPLIVGEMGETDCAYSFIDGLMDWLDQQGQNYLAWHWWPLTDVPCSNYALITDYASANPSGYGVGLKNRLAALYGS